MKNNQRLTVCRIGFRLILCRLIKTYNIKRRRSRSLEVSVHLTPHPLVRFVCWTVCSVHPVQFSSSRYCYPALLCLFPRSSCAPRVDFGFMDCSPFLFDCCLHSLHWPAFCYCSGLSSLNFFLTYYQPSLKLALCDESACSCISIFALVTLFSGCKALKQSFVHFAIDIFCLHEQPESTKNEIDY